VNGKIKDLQQQIEQDKQIIALREGIYGKSIKKVENGTETTNEMVRDINAVNQARQQKAVHEILLLQEIYQLKNINND
jgi:kynurenine formamidase